MTAPDEQNSERDRAALAMSNAYYAKVPIITAQDSFDARNRTLDALIALGWQSPAEVAALRAQVESYKATIKNTTQYVDDPGNWSALVGRRNVILALLASVVPAPVLPEQDGGES